MWGVDNVATFVRMVQMVVTRHHLPSSHRDHVRHGRHHNSSGERCGQDEADEHLVA